jgi:general secretion pathway protein G
MNREAFTMIELIFVIVILGILASTAIPKLSATREDARITKEMANAKQCITDMCAGYTGSGVMPALNSYNSCIAAQAATTVTVSLNAGILTISGSPGGSLDGDTDCAHLQVQRN